MDRSLGQAVELIKSFEGIPDGDPTTVNLDPYLCPAGYWTIGWGHVALDPRGKQIKGAENKALARSVYPGGITKAEAEVLLTDDVRRFSAGVEQLLKVTVSDVKFCALVSFAFNVGYTRWSVLPCFDWSIGVTSFTLHPSFSSGPRRAVKSWPD